MPRRNNQKPIVRNDIKRVDESTAEIVTGINYLLAHARKEGLATVTTILKDAQESIAWWAAYDGYNESSAERLYHHLTFDSGLHTALDFLAKFAAIKDEHIRDELLQAIGQLQLTNPLSSKVTLEA